MGQLIINVEARLTGLEVNPEGPRLTLHAGLVDDNGNTVRSFTEDVTDQLTVNQMQALQGLVAKATAWVASKAP